MPERPATTTDAGIPIPSQEHSLKTLELVGRYRHLLDATDRKAAAMLEEA